MAASGGSVSYGSTLKYDSGGGSYVAIAEVVSIDSPELDVTATEFTHLTSDNNHKEYKPGMVEPGQLGAEINYLKATITLLKGFVDNGTVQSWRIVSSQGSYLTFSGFMKTLKPFDVPLDDKLGASITIKLSGKPVFTEV
jgi:hypothetical protein